MMVAAREIMPQLVGQQNGHQGNREWQTAPAMPRDAGTTILNARINSSTETDLLCAKATANCVPATRQLHSVTTKSAPASTRLLREGRSRAPCSTNAARERCASRTAGETAGRYFLGFAWPRMGRDLGSNHQYSTVARAVPLEAQADAQIMSKFNVALRSCVTRRAWCLPVPAIPCRA